MIHEAQHKLKVLLYRGDGSPCRKAKATNNILLSSSKHKVYHGLENARVKVHRCRTREECR